MKWRCLLATSLATGTLALVCPSSSHAQHGFASAGESIGIVSSRFGPQAVQWLAEVSAEGGVPQPNAWEIVAYDERSPLLLFRFWTKNGQPGEYGPERGRYPMDVPVGFFSPNQVAVDSVAAFTIVEGEARKARMSFDSCDYLLRVRDFSSEPIWRLELYDDRRQIVGKIYLSASNGQVLRTVWVYRDHRARPDGHPLIIDSVAPGHRQQHFSSPTSQGGYAPPPPAGQNGLTAAPPLMPAPSAGSDNLQGAMAPPPVAPIPPAPAGPPTAAPPLPGGIPEPPPIGGTDIPEPPAPGEATGGMRDLRDMATPPASAPSGPPVNTPDTSGGAGGRIPPPPIPQ